MRTIIKPYERATTDYSNGQKVYYLAGGTEALRLNSSVPSSSTLVDLSLVLDKSLKLEKSILTIGNGVTFTDLIESSLVPAAIKKSAHFCASFAIRNAATVCGNIATCRDDSYMLPVLLSYGAVVNYVVGDKEYNQALSTYIKAEAKGLILSITLNCEKKVEVKRIGLTSSSHAVVIVARSAELIAVAVKGSGVFVAANLDSLIEQIKFTTDMFGSAEYKEYLVKTICEKLSKELAI